MSSNASCALSQLRSVGSLIKFSHTVFALPFALSMLIIVMRDYPVSIVQLGWILTALVSARAAAMALNRLVDRDIDALNPRTREREIPAGKLSVTQVRVFLTLSTVVFVGSAWALGTHCLVLSPLVLLVLFAYSWTKRFTAQSHIVLGLALALAPGGVWYALTAQVALLPFLMMTAVLLWVAGFDILYSCQDVEFDRAQGLFSLPALLGVTRAFLIARILHFVALVPLVLLGLEAKLGASYYVGLSLFALTLLSQHMIVSPSNLARIDAAFFTRNGVASLIFFVAVVCS